MCACLRIAAAGTVSDACREEVYQFYVQRNTNINKNVPLGECKKTKRTLQRASPRLCACVHESSQKTRMTDNFWMLPPTVVAARSFLPFFQSASSTSSSLPLMAPKNYTKQSCVHGFMFSGFLLHIIQLATKERSNLWNK